MLSKLLAFILSVQFLAGVAVGYLVLGNVLGILMRGATGLTSGGASPTGYPVNEGRY